MAKAAIKYTGPSQAQQAACIRNFLILRIRRAYSLANSLPTQRGIELQRCLDATLKELGAESETDRRYRVHQESAAL